VRTCSTEIRATHPTSRDSMNISCFSGSLQIVWVTYCELCIVTSAILACCFSVLYLLVSALRQNIGLQTKKCDTKLDKDAEWYKYMRHIQGLNGRNMDLFLPHPSVLPIWTIIVWSEKHSSLIVSICFLLLSMTSGHQSQETRRENFWPPPLG
jgi:hypothetical protein